MTRKPPIQGEVKPLSELRGGQTKKRSQEAVRLSQKATRHEMLADIADRDGETHTAILERSDAKRARAEAEPLLERIGPTGRILEAAGEIAVLDKGPQGMTLHPNICTVLEYPNSIAVEASQRRMELATQAEALEPALDAAVAGEARNDRADAPPPTRDCARPRDEVLRDVDGLQPAGQRAPDCRTGTPTQCCGAADGRIPKRRPGASQVQARRDPNRDR